MNERNESRNEQIELIRQLVEPHPVVIGIEGGPCGGKTTLVENVLSQAGDRKVVVLPEAASQHINALAEQGINFADLITDDREQFLRVESEIMKTIVQNIKQAREVYSGTNTIILADRCDLQAYVTPDEHNMLLRRAGEPIAPFLGHVDQLYYLPSVARLDPELYEALKLSNTARYESAEDASSTCERNLAAVARHPELHVAWGGDFDAAIARMTQSILNPDLESEVKLKPKYGNTMTDIVILGGEIVSESDITQTYHELGGQNFRLRATRTEQGEKLYSFTIKHGNGITRKELQRRLTEQEYLTLITAPATGAPLEKRRSMVMLPGESKAQRRLWAFDRYYDRRLQEWTLETDVDDEAVAAQLAESLYGYEREENSAEMLSRFLARRALLPLMLR